MFKRILSIVLVILIAATLCVGCNNQNNGNNGNNVNNGATDNTSSNLWAGLVGVDENGNWKEVKKVSEPNYASADMTLKEFEDAYRPYTDWRIYQIRTTKSDVKPANGGKAYYVSNKGNNNNDGLTPETPVDSYTTIMGKLNSGDVVYFERGSEFRGTFSINKPGITFAAYGEGRAPVFRAYKESAAGKGKWIATDKPNVYVFYEKVTVDVGVVVFDDTYFTYKSFYTKDDVSSSKSKKQVNSYKDLKEDLQMYHDPVNFAVYVYCEKGNPGEVYESVELVTKGVAVAVNAENVTIDNLCFLTSGFGVRGASSVEPYVTKGLTVRNCEFGWIGGYSTSIAKDERLGNGIEIWGGAEDFLVENCYFRQIYDAGVTFQYSSTNKDSKFNNIIFRNNVFEYCNYSIEYFVTTKNKSKIKDFVIDGNIFWYAGEGMCTQRPDLSGSNHIKSWGHDNYCTNQIKVTNNFFAIGARQLCETYDKSGLGAAYNKNVYAQTENKRLVRNGLASSAFKLDAKAKENIEKELGDKNAVIIKIAK